MTPGATPYWDPALIACTAISSRSHRRFQRAHHLYGPGWTNREQLRGRTVSVALLRVGGQHPHCAQVRDVKRRLSCPLHERANDSDVRFLRDESVVPDDPAKLWECHAIAGPQRDLCGRFLQRYRHRLNAFYPRESHAHGVSAGRSIHAHGFERHAANLSPHGRRAEHHQQ